MASSRPVPLIADVLKIWYFLFFKDGNPSAFATSAAVMAPSISCLFANTHNTAFLSSSSFSSNKIFKFVYQFWRYTSSIANNSVLDIPILSRSILSTT